MEKEQKKYPKLSKKDLGFIVGEYKHLTSIIMKPESKIIYNFRMAYLFILKDALIRNKSRLTLVQQRGLNLDYQTPLG
jgi:hypothetical protein